MNDKQMKADKAYEEEADKAYEEEADKAYEDALKERRT